MRALRARLAVALVIAVVAFTPPAAANEPIGAKQRVARAAAVVKTTVTTAARTVAETITKTVAKQSALTVRVVMGGMMSDFHLDGVRATLRSTAGGTHTDFSIAPDQAVALREAARHALDDKWSRTRCLGAETAVVVTIGEETRTGALCSGSPRREDSRWSRVLELLRAALPPGA